MYGRPIFPAFVFLQFNVLQGGSAWFGTHPWHWYFSQGIFAVFGLHLALVMYAAPSAPWVLTASLLLPVLGFSMLGHKEFRCVHGQRGLFVILLRFIMFLIPLGMAFCGRALDTIYLRKSKRAAFAVVAVLALLNIPAFVYLSRYHQV